MKNVPPKEKKSITPFSAEELDAPFTSEDLKQMQANPVEYSRFVTAYNKARQIADVVGLRGQMSDQVFHLCVRYICQPANRKNAFDGDSVVKMLNTFALYDKPADVLLTDEEMTVALSQLSPEARQDSYKAYVKGARRILTATTPQRTKEEQEQIELVRPKAIAFHRHFEKSFSSLANFNGEWIKGAIEEWCKVPPSKVHSVYCLFLIIWHEEGMTLPSDAMQITGNR